MGVLRSAVATCVRCRLVRSTIAATWRRRAARVAWVARIGESGRLTGGSASVRFRRWLDVVGRRRQGPFADAATADDAVENPAGAGELVQAGSRSHSLVSRDRTRRGGVGVQVPP